MWPWFPAAILVDCPVYVPLSNFLLKRQHLTHQTVTSKSLKNQPVFFQPRWNPLVILFTHCWGQNDYDRKLAEGYQSTGAFGPWDSWESEPEFPYKSLLSRKFSGLGIQKGQKMNSLLCFRMSRVSAGRLVGWRLDSIIWRLIYLHVEWLILAIGLWPQSFSLWTSIQVWLGFLASWQLDSKQKHLERDSLL